MDIADLERKGDDYRRAVIRLILSAGAGHTGGDLSMIDMLNVLYNRVMINDPAHPDDPGRDYFFLSKGHGAEALYVVLEDRGFLRADQLAGLGRAGSDLAGHPVNSLPGVEHNTGALGHGLSVALGTALALKGRGNRVFCLMGDGELAEGSVWEAAMAAGHYGLGRLTALVDRNGLQISGRTEDIMAMEPLADRWRSFGWECREVDGHDYGGLITALEEKRPSRSKPLCLIAKTVKGKGFPPAEGNLAWHHRVPEESLVKEVYGDI